jgi:hypothetical protein
MTTADEAKRLELLKAEREIARTTMHLRRLEGRADRLRAELLDSDGCDTQRVEATR